MTCHKLCFGWIFAHADVWLALPVCSLSTLDLTNTPLICLLGPFIWWKTSILLKYCTPFLQGLSAETLDLHHFLKCSQKFSDWDSSCQAQFIWSGTVLKMYRSKDFRGSYHSRLAFLSRQLKILSKGFTQTPHYLLSYLSSVDFCQDLVLSLQLLIFMSRLWDIC